MDIASVYLNLATLLGTEIEVEGHYGATSLPETVFLYAVEHEQASEKIFLPRYLGNRDLVNYSHGRSIPARVFIKGTLKQNAHGDLLLSSISSFSYRTNVVVLNIRITYSNDRIVCRQTMDLVFNWLAYVQDVHRPIRDLTLASAIVSKPVLLEGYLTPYIYGPPSHEVILMMAVKNVVYSVLDLWQQKTAPSPSDVTQLLFGGRFPWDEAPAKYTGPKFIDLMGYTKIWIPKDFQANDYLNLYFDSLKQGVFFSRETDVKFTFAGTVSSLDKSERKEKGFSHRTQLIFTSIDYITSRRTTLFKTPQDE